MVPDNRIWHIATCMKANTHKRVSKGEWLAQALEVLAAEGVQGIRVERLARDLKISKSGFYWHFADRDDLLRQLLDYWAYEYTEVVRQNKELLKFSPRDRLNQIASMLRKYNFTKYELSIRAWAAYDPKVAEIVAQVYRQRMDYIREVFRQLGFSGDELEMRTTLYICYHSWETTVLGGESERKLARLQKLRLDLLTSR